MEPLPNRPASDDDLRDYPEKVRAEVLSGVVRVQPSPLPRHNDIVLGLGTEIASPFDRRGGPDDPGGWWIPPFDAIDLDLGRLFPPATEPTSP